MGLKSIAYISIFSFSIVFVSCKNRKESYTCTHPNNGSKEIVERKHYSRKSQYESELKKAEEYGWVCVKN